jgi:hypothetical protein
MHERNLSNSQKELQSILVVVFFLCFCNIFVSCPFSPFLCFWFLLPFFHLCFCLCFSGLVGWLFLSLTYPNLVATKRLGCCCIMIYVNPMFFVGLVVASWFMWILCFLFPCRCSWKSYYVGYHCLSHKLLYYGLFVLIVYVNVCRIFRDVPKGCKADLRRHPHFSTPVSLFQSGLRHLPSSEALWRRRSPLTSFQWG